MKKVVLPLLFAALTLTTACHNRKGDPEDENVPAVMKDTVAADNTDVAVPDADDAKTVQESLITVTGKVTDIRNGKDGYTATLKSIEGNEYKATISIPNLNDPKQYRSVKTGDTITVKGEPFAVGKENHIRVTEFL